MTALWLVVIAASTATLCYQIRTRAMHSPTAVRESALDRDDADAVISAFGAPDEDRPSGIDPQESSWVTRTMIYKGRSVRVMFLLRSRGAPLRRLWKLIGFTELDGRRSLSGEEALRRLLSERQGTPSLQGATRR